MDITEISKVLGPLQCPELLGFHAFTGSDYTSEFFRMGKKRSFKILEEYKDAQDAFAKMAKESLREDSRKVTMSYTARIYAAKPNNTLSLNMHHYKTFQDLCTKSESKEPSGETSWH